MSTRIPGENISKVLVRALDKGYFDGNNTIIFHDLDFIKRQIETVTELFPENSLHTIAAKANPLPALLKFMLPLGVGCEAATIGEVYLALKSGYEASKIVFDSPAKTNEELAFALEKGIHINADSFIELDRIAKIKKNIKSSRNIGLRINPQTGAGKILFTSVAGKYSKFGVPFNENEDRIVQYYNKYKWLNGIHCHVGSQGNTLEQLVSAACKITDLIKKLSRPLSWIDIGGGLPVNYSEKDNAPTYEDYYNLLRQKCPALLSGSYKIITEFGRSIHANAGWTASRVEYVKKYSSTTTAVIHVGADLFMRRIYHPQHWHHDLSVVDKQGQLKSGPKEKVTIAGPLCFNGDNIAHDIELPSIEEGDYIIIHDSGGYTLSMWSRYNSRLMPRVLGYTQNGENFQLLKKEETLEDLYRFWS